MEPSERLLAIEEIHQLKARYFRCMDTKDYAGLMTVFAEDAEFDARNSARDGDDEASISQMYDDSWIWRGRDVIVSAIRERTSHVRTMHHGHMPEIEILSPTTAKGLWAMEDVIVEDRPEGQVTVLHGYGHYGETYVKRDGRWQISTSRITRLHVKFPRE